MRRLAANKAMVARLGCTGGAKSSPSYPIEKSIGETYYGGLK
jgi:hypothetical protein